MSYTGYSIKTNADLAQEITDRTAAVAAEASARSSAISAEATARGTAISAAIAQEVTDRDAAILVETNARATAVSAEATARASAISAEATARGTAISAAIAQEVTDRDAAIAVETAARASAVSAEASARATAISAAIQQEVADRDSAITAATSGLGTAANITALDTRLSSLETWKTDNSDGLQSALDDAIASNTTLIGSVETALQNKDSALITGINQHLADRHASDNSISAAIDQSSSNDNKLVIVLSSIVTYLDAFSQTYSVVDSNGNTVSPPNWSNLTTNLNQVLAHSATITQSQNLWVTQWFKLQKYMQTI